MIEGVDVRKLQDYIGKRVIVRIRDEHGKFMLGGSKKYPFTLKEVNKDYIKLVDESAGISHDIKINNLYMIWERANNAGFGYAKKGKIIYASEKNIKKRYREIENLNGWPLHAIRIIGEILIFIEVLIMLLNLGSYIKLIGPLLLTPPLSNAIIPILQTTGPGIIFYLSLSILLSFISISLIFFYLPDTIKAPLKILQAKWENDYIDLLEWKADISLDEEGAS